MTIPQQEEPGTRHKPPHPGEREYDQSGFYPAPGEGKPFRIWALLGWLAGVVVFLALASATLNYLLLR